MTNKRAIGSHYEAKAAEFLKKQGYEILDCNYQDRYGEIDLVARDGDYLVFVEVKYRSNLKIGYPEEAVTDKKQQKIRHGARYYLYRHDYSEDTPCRFDVVSILGEEIRLVCNAF